MMRRVALLGAAGALTACSGGNTSPNPFVARAPIAQSSAPAGATSQTQATFTVHWPSTGQNSSSKGRNTLSPSTQSVSVSVNGGPGTVVNKPTVTGSPATTSISIAAPPGNDQFTYTAWDKVDASGAVLDQSTVSQSIIANANNAVSVVLDGVCAALVPSLSATPAAPYSTYQNTSVPLASGSRTVLKSASVIGPMPLQIQFTPVDADGNTILTTGGTAPISVAESGTTPHVNITPLASGAANTSFTLTPILAQVDATSTTITASSPNCGSGTTTFANSFQLSTVAEVVVADPRLGGIFAFDQDGNYLATLLTGSYYGLAYNSKSNYFMVLALTTLETTGQYSLAFTTFGLTGKSIASGTFFPQNTPNDPDAQFESPTNIIYDPANNDFIFGLKTDGTYNGAIEEISISGSTATVIDATENGILKSPSAFVALPNGDFAVSDGNDDLSQIVEYTDKLSIANYSTDGTLLSFDSTRGNIYDFVNSSGSSQGYTLDESVENGAAFTVPNEPYLASVYSPGNDEYYLFQELNCFAITGSSIAQGGSTISVAPSNAFHELIGPQQAVAFP